MRKALKSYFYPEQTVSQAAKKADIDTATTTATANESEGENETAALVMPTTAASEGGKPSVVPVGHAVADYALGHFVVNTVFFGPTFFAAMMQLYSAVPLAILGFARDDLHFGQAAPAVFPLAINVVPLTLAAIENAVRYKNGSLAQKQDVMVHTPFLKLQPFQRTHALFMFLFATGLQVFNGATEADPRFAGTVTDDVMKDAYKNAFFTFYVQMMLSIALYNLSTKIVMPLGAALWVEARECVTAVRDRCITPVQSL
ncbi:MAG: hypothetical protein A3J38_05885 [Gammaproteobacteria bacterium RIFCSPHIGHO2_12_FULL_45_9]|nr:MAG: hypothetical protein A3J38_05885 [Gammaproteobacteria bacterium RIFCSPHIGHO2_12_FULL_45_9]